MGWVVAGGHKFAITGLCLRKGYLVITATAPGPVPAMKYEPVAIFGEGGQGFCQGPPGTGLTVRETRAGESALVLVSLQMMRVT